MDPAQAFDVVIKEYDKILIPFHSNGLGLARGLFTALVVIQIAWSAILWIVNRDSDAHSIIVEFSKKMLFIGFFWGLLTIKSDWIFLIFKSFGQAGFQMGNIKPVSPTGIVRHGINLFMLIFHKVGDLGLLQKATTGLTALLLASCILFIFCRVACEMVLIQIGGKIILFAGVIMLGFAGSSWTMEYAKRYFSAAINLGIKLMFIIILVGIGNELGNNWIVLISNAPKDDLLMTCLSVVASAFVYYFLSLRVPDMASSLLTGSFSIGFGHGDASVTALYHGTKATAATAGSLMGAAGKTATNTLGAMGAVKSALGMSASTASNQGKTGLSKAVSTIGGAVKTLSKAAASRGAEKISNAVSGTSGGRITDKIKTLK